MRSNLRKPLMLEGYSNKTKEKWTKKGYLLVVVLLILLGNFSIFTLTGYASDSAPGIDLPSNQTDLGEAEATLQAVEGVFPPEIAQFQEPEPPPPANETESNWSLPVNASQSGSANFPTMALDAEENLFILFQDTLEGEYRYVSQPAGKSTWSRPVSIEPPFGTRVFHPELFADQPTPLFQPILVPGDPELFYAIWVNDRQELTFSRILTQTTPVPEPDGSTEPVAPVITTTTGVTNSLPITLTTEPSFLFPSRLEEWSIPVILDFGAVFADLVIDSEGILHVVFIHLESAPNPAANLPQSLLERQAASGIYHTQSSDRGRSWTVPNLLYESEYFRQLTNTGLHLDLTVDTGDINLVWEDPIDEKIFFSSYLKRVQGWSPPFLVDEREALDPVGGARPSKIVVGEIDGKRHLFWVAGHNDLICTVYTMSEQEETDTWGPRSRLNDRLPCPDSLAFVGGEFNPTLFIRSGSDAYLLAKEESGWNELEIQPVLSTFKDPTTFRDIIFVCSDQLLETAEDLIFGNCGQSVYQDVWVTKRSLDTLNIPELVPPVWNAPLEIGIQSSHVFDLKSVVDSENVLHTLWIKSDQDINTNTPVINPGNSILYTRTGVEGDWSSPVHILSSPDGGSVNDLDIAYNPKTDNLLVAWTGGEENRLFFSQAPVISAPIPEEWPGILELNEDATYEAESPSISVSPNGVLYIVYSVAINEERGIYLTVSYDDGISWAPPINILPDALSWSEFADPKIVASADGTIHVTWLHVSGASQSSLVELNYTSGQLPAENRVLEDIVWQSPIQVKNRFLIDNSILWYDMLGNPNSSLHLVWQEWNESQISLWHQYSETNGRDWEESSQLTGFGMPIGIASATLDPLNNLHLVQLSNPPNAQISGIMLQHWKLNQDGWVSQEPAFIESIVHNGYDITNLSVSGTGSLIFNFSGQNQLDQISIPNLFTVDRSIEVGDGAVVTGDGGSSTGGESAASEDLAETELSGTGAESGILGDGSSGSTVEEEVPITIDDNLPDLTTIERFSGGGSLSVGGLTALLTSGSLVFAIFILTLIYRRRFGR